MNTKKNRVVILLSFLLVSGIICSLLPSGYSEHFGDFIYVDDDNTKGPWNGSSAYPYQHIREGIENASHGDTIFVRNGFYHEHIDIYKTLSLIGENKTNTIIDGRGIDDVVLINAPNVNITNFTIRNSGKIANDSGFRIITDGNIIVNNNIVDNNRGIRIYKASNNIIYGNNFVLNTIHAVVEDGSNSWDNGTIGNYWDDYNGTDSDGDGIGDVPYIINKDNQDRYPLMSANGHYYINEPPIKPWNPHPIHEEQNTSIYTKLTWNGGDPNHGDIVTYDVYFCDDISELDLMISNQSKNSYNPGILDHEKQYFWRIIAWDSNGAKSMNQSWSFTTKKNNKPNKSHNPSPYDGAKKVSRTKNLRWGADDPDDDELYFDVYFGTNTNPSKVKENITDNSYNPGKLKNETKYYWRIDIWDEFGLKTKGDVWNFTTRPPDNIKPIADAGGPYIGYVNTEVTIQGKESTDSDGVIAIWTWDFGDGTTGTGETTTHIYATEGTYNITLTITDDRNAKAIDTTTIVISKANHPPSKPVIEGPSEGIKSFPYEFKFRSDDEDNDYLIYTVYWDDGTSDKSSLLKSEDVFYISHSWSSYGIYDIKIQVSDNLTTTENQYTVWIDTHKVSTIGYLIDNDSDMVYDIFHDNIFGSESKIKKKNDGTYLLDTDGNNLWDSVFDPISNDVSEIEEVKEQDGIPILYVEIIIGLIIICLICFIFIRKRHDHKQQIDYKQLQQNQQDKSESRGQFIQINSED
jgi:parallel beta-helix repeat protein